MSHFTVTVALPGEIPAEELGAALDQALDPFDENKVVPRYVQFTRDQLIAKGRQKIESYKSGLYADYLADPVAYREKCFHPAHLDYISGNDEAGGFPAKLSWSDDQVYQDEIRWHDDVGPAGEVYSTDNPKSKWDWWVVGGRWGAYWTLRDGAQRGPLATEPSAFGMAEDADCTNVADNARISEIVPESMRPTYALVTPDGEWHEKGRMGWFGMSFDDKPEEEWEADYLRAIQELPPDTWLVMVDAHI